ncbi:MAG: glutathione S-transferase family protein [Stappiaceae bacterium]
MLKLYYAKGTAAMVPHILLEEAGASYETELLDFSTGAQKEGAYLKLNPKARVPALETSEGILTETPAILAYIAQAFPDADLAPKSAFGFAQAQAFNSYLSSTVHVNHAHKMRGHRWSDDPAAHESMRAKVASNMTECAQMIEDHYFRGPWVLGEHYSICDAYLYVIARWLPGDGVSMDGFQKLVAHSEAMNQRPAVQRILPSHS